LIASLVKPLPAALRNFTPMMLATQLARRPPLFPAAPIVLTHAFRDSCRPGSQVLVMALKPCVPLAQVMAVHRW
jgi:hypothetical protein